LAISCDDSSSQPVQTRHHVFRMIEGRAWLYVVGVIFRGALELSYKDFVVPWYEGVGFVMVENAEKYVESWLLYISLLLLLPAKVRRPSDFLIGLAFFTFLAPLLVFYGFTDASRWALYCVLTQYVIVNLVRSGRPMRVPVIKNGPVVARMVAIAGVIIAATWMIASGGFATFNLNLDAVYEFREDAGRSINVGIFSYIVVWVPAVCSPLLLMRALRDRHRTLAVIIVLLHVFWFGMTSHKAVLFFPVLVMFLHTVFKHSRALSLIPAGTSVVVMISLISYYATGSLFLSGMFVRRVFFTSSHLTFTYFEFFAQNPLIYWSNSFLSSLVNYPYDVSVPLVIGNYLNDPTGWANNSFFATGYMHAGLLGVAIYGVVAGVVLKVVDSLVTTAVPLWMSLSIIIVPFFTLVTSADLTTALLTHGLGFAIFMLYLMKARGEMCGTRADTTAEAEIGGPSRDSDAQRLQRVRDVTRLECVR
jgi:hypothetical protein